MVLLIYFFMYRLLHVQHMYRYPDATMIKIWWRCSYDGLYSIIRNISRIAFPSKLRNDKQLFICCNISKLIFKLYGKKSQNFIPNCLCLEECKIFGLTHDFFVIIPRMNLINKLFVTSGISMSKFLLTFTIAVKAASTSMTWNNPLT